MAEKIINNIISKFIMLTCKARNCNALFLYLGMFIHFSAKAQNEWELKKDKDGIKVYMSNNNHSAFNELKVEMIIQSKLSSLAALLLDVKNDINWVYSVKSISLIKKVSENELYFYEEINSPFPASNRDLIIHLKITQDTATKIMTISAINVPDYLPPQKNIVRVPLSKESWVVTPVNNKSIKIVYYLEIDPGGSVPAWLINNFSEKGPYESFKHLQSQVQLLQYKNVSLSFIKD
jgi:hypothetical protein